MFSITASSQPKAVFLWQLNIDNFGEVGGRLELAYENGGFRGKWLSQLIEARYRGTCGNQGAL
jgi:hypothetical protein